MVELPDAVEFWQLARPSDRLAHDQGGHAKKRDDTDHIGHRGQYHTAGNCWINPELP